MSIGLATLLQRMTCKVIAGTLDVHITSVEFDSRKVREGSLFVAIKGFTSDGHDYIEKAAAAGASCIVADLDREKHGDEELKAISEQYGCTVIAMKDSRKAGAELCAAFYAHPEDRLDLVGVTGTKGKTTITFMIHDILDRAGRSNGLIGTVCNMIGGEKRTTSHTTPESHEIYEILDELARKNFDSCVMEVSSQGLKMDRVYGLRFDVGCFTNLYEDHIGGDEHPDMEDYIRCKLRLFDNSRIAVVNRDCNVADRVIEYAAARCPVYTYGMSENCDCRADNLRSERRGSVTGTVFDLESPWYSGDVFVALPGKFNVYNALCAIVVAGILKIDFKFVKEALADTFVPGRVQPVPNDLDITVLVDYAHNAASLENVLSTLRDYTSGRIISVFGCGGNRSATRRFEMGEVSGRLADHTVITSDNPRKEDPMLIIENIVTGMKRTDGEYEIEPDRKEAIRKAIQMSRPGDTVLIAGKGHEDYQIFADKTIHFDDVEVAAEILRAKEAQS